MCCGNSVKQSAEIAPSFSSSRGRFGPEDDGGRSSDRYETYSQITALYCRVELLKYLANQSNRHIPKYQAHTAL